MALLAWSADLDTGIDVIDRQHKRIVDYINYLYEARLKHDRAAIGRVIEEAVDYTLSHLSFEETLLEDAGYEFVRPHKMVHKLFVNRVAEFQLRYKSGEDISEELHGLLSRWLFNHIRIDDAAYVPSVKASMQPVPVLTQQAKPRGWLTRFIQGT